MPSINAIIAKVLLHFSPREKIEDNVGYGFVYIVSFLFISKKMYLFGTHILWWKKWYFNN